MSILLELSKILIPKSFLGKMKIGEEDRTCIQFANYLRQKTLDGDFPYVWFHVPNQIAVKRPIFGVKQAWMGRISGVPDYCFMGKNCFFIEFKSEKGRLSDSQNTYIKWCENVEVPVYICRSYEEAKEIIDGK